MKLLTNSSSIITRPGFCPNCSKEEQLKTGKSFLVYGATGWHHRTARQNSRYWGFVPTIYKLHKVIGSNVVVLRCCAVEGCGSEWKLIENQWMITIQPENYIRIIYPLEKWNALVLNPYWHDLQYYV